MLTADNDAIRRRLEGVEEEVREYQQSGDQSNETILTQVDQCMLLELVIIVNIMLHSVHSTWARCVSVRMRV